ncbi:MAG: NADH-quinone oxidoreductase subunit F, partial [Candidatus Cloacimonetes bacterium]|nr:NADH-quinone oxidoreductase subunit F [Candidatus Cloacimonadota bacterium]
MEKIIAKLGLGSCGIAAGADVVWTELEKVINESKYPVELRKTACIGMCFEEPVLELSGKGKSKVMLGTVEAKDVKSILDGYLNDKLEYNNIILHEHKEAVHNELIGNQQRIVLRNCGIIDPESIEDYEAAGGYQALAKALNMRRTDIIDIVKESGLRGRGGAGFSTGMKWQFAYNARSEKKYVVCNADEGDPGAFMDRSTLEGDPHSIIEAMIIGAFAMGADEGYLYVRAEYPMAIKHLRKAIADAEAKGYLGQNIMGKGFNCELHIKEGAGAFVCGEE